MAGFLFHDVVFGPVMSRRLGVSLGINLLPLNKKVCSFNCIYCECGWTESMPENSMHFFSTVEIAAAMESRFRELMDENIAIDAITFAGNGEPTLHPEFGKIIDITIQLRDKYLKGAEITVLSNSTTLNRPSVLEALKKADRSIMKLDAGDDFLFQTINQPMTSVTRAEIVKNLQLFEGKLIVQSLFLRGKYKGIEVDNTPDRIVDEWIGELKQINPEYVMIYPIARLTPAEDMQKVSLDDLNTIAAKLESAGIKAKVYP